LRAGSPDRTTDGVKGWQRGVGSGGDWAPRCRSRGWDARILCEMRKNIPRNLNFWG